MLWKIMSGIKTIKFKPHLIKPILDGAKTVTWRLFDDKDLQNGDSLEFINSENGEKFAEAEIVNSQEKKILELTDSDLAYNNYQDRAQVLALNSKYYGKKVGNSTIVKIIEFKCGHRNKN